MARGAETFLTELALGRHCAVAANTLVAVDAPSEEAIRVQSTQPALGQLSIVTWRINSHWKQPSAGGTLVGDHFL